MNPKVSVIIPAIRTDNWRYAYETLKKSMESVSFELIFVSPYELPDDLRGIDNIKWKQDWGTPVRCSNIALTMCEGELTTWQSDDGSWRLGSMEEVVNMFDALSTKNLKNVIQMQYKEGSGTQHWELDKAYPLVNNARGKGWHIFNFCLMYTDYIKQLGGWDCQFETCAFAHADMAVRAQQDECHVVRFIKGNEYVAVVDNGHGQSDHKPIEDGHNLNDYPLYCKIHNDPENRKRINLNINNWQNSPERWARRFG